MLTERRRHGTYNRNLVGHLGRSRQQLRDVGSCHIRRNWLKRTAYFRGGVRLYIKGF